MVDRDLATYRQLLASNIESYQVLVHPAIAPAADSEAASEVEQGRLRAGESEPWGERPVRTCYAAALMSYIGAVEHARAMVALMTGEFTALPLGVLTRGVLELTSRAWWLLEPGIGAANRVMRLQTVKYRSATEGERTATKTGVPAEEHHEYTETCATVEQYSRRLGLPVPVTRGGSYVCGTETLPGVGPRIGSMFASIDVPGLYNLYSGFAHGEMYALWQSFEEVPTFDGLRRYRPAARIEPFWGAAATTIWALHAAALRAMVLFGLDPAGVKDWLDDHDELLNPPD